MATTRCALYNVRVNLPDLTDRKLRREAEESIETLLSHAKTHIQRVGPRIWERQVDGK